MRVSRCFVILWGFLFLVMPFTGIAQITIDGTVTDSAGRSLPQVTVSVTDSASQAIKGYGITNSNGYFKIQLSRAGTFMLKVTALGFLPMEKRIRENIFSYHFRLRTGVNELPEIRVKNQTMVTAKGDTLNYNVQQFTRPQDRTIGDIIKNLPGITVNASGTISYNGRPINKFYIDGDDLLGDKYAIASNTLPADVVTAVQILENHQPVRLLEDKVPSDNAALNLKLSNSSKLRVFGSGNAAAGMPWLAADVRVNVLSFKKQLKFINSYAYNSIGGDLKSEVQSQSSGNIWQSQVNHNLTPLLGFTALPQPVIPARYYTNNKTHSGTLNFLLPLRKDESLRLNGYWLPGEVNNDTRASNIYYTPADTIYQLESQRNRIKTSNLYFNATYLLNARQQYIQNQLSIEHNTVNGNAVVVNEKEVNGFAQQLQDTYTSVRNKFQLKKNLPRAILAELSSDIQYQQMPELLTIDLGIYPWLLNNSVAYSQAGQHARQQTTSSITELALNKTIRHFMLGMRTEHLAEVSRYTSGIDIWQHNHELTQADSGFRNQLHWQQQRVTATPSVLYKYRKWQVSLLLPVLWRHIRYENKFAEQDTLSSRVSLQPALRISVETGNYAKLLLNARRETDFTDAQELLPGAMLVNYRNLSQRIQLLQYNHIHTLSLSYSYRNPLKIRFFNAGVVYSRNSSPVINGQSFREGIISNTQQLFANITQRCLVVTSYSKYIFPLKTTFKASYNGSWLQYYQVQANVVNQLRSLTHNAGIALTIKPVWNFNTELGLNYMVSATRNISQESNIGKPVTLLTSNLVSTYNFSDNLFLQADINYVAQSAEGSSNHYALADARLNYTIPKTKTDIGIKAINLFNERRLYVRSIDGLQVSANDYWLRPCTVMLTGSFRF